MGGAWIVWALGLGCAGWAEPSVLTDAVAAEVGQRLCAAGHPQATCAAGELEEASLGGWPADPDGRPQVDLRVPYTKAGKKGQPEERYTLRLRLKISQLQPCRASVEVRSDDGPKPILLDNALSSRLAGDALCRALALK
jgi:hypothetical protein